MNETIDVVGVQLRDARVGDWLADCKSGEVVAVIERIESGVLRAWFEQANRGWNWDLDGRIDKSKSTLPVMASLRSEMADYVRLAQVLDIVRPVTVQHDDAT
jgi:hypothetical protein